MYFVSRRTCISQFLYSYKSIDIDCTNCGREISIDEVEECNELFSSFSIHIINDECQAQMGYTGFTVSEEEVELI